MNPRNYLKGNAMFLPVHWIYDRTYIKDVVIKRDIFNLVYNPKDYTLSHPSYDSYPNQVQGDTTTQGVIFNRLLEIYDSKKTLTRSDYESVLHEMFVLETYKGYQESFIKNYVSNQKGETKIQLLDDHTVYMLPYLILKDINKAEMLSKVFNEDLEYHREMCLLDQIVKKDYNVSIKEAYIKALKTLSLPDVYHHVLDTIDLDTFLSQYAGSSCSIRHAMPVIYYLVTRYPLQEALYYNVLVGGSIAERAGFIYYLLGDYKNRLIKTI
jgi:hypothetical protein